MKRKFADFEMIIWTLRNLQQKLWTGFILLYTNRYKTEMQICFTDLGRLNLLMAVQF
jgi:hypothetical protein